MILPMFYFLFTSLTFFLRKLNDPVVTWLLRGLFDTYFIAVIACCVLGILAFVLAGRPAIATGIGLIAAIAFGARRWFLQQLDLQIHARDAGDADAVRRLRRLHVGGILYNAVQTSLIIASIPHVFATA